MSEQPVISEDVFAIPSSDGVNYILYMPLKKIALKVNPDVIELIRTPNTAKLLSAHKETLSKLKEAGIFDGFAKVELPQDTSTSLIKATKVTLFPTTDCNLKCVYCYGNGGDHHHIIDEKIARSSIDTVINNASYQHKKRVGLSLHGSGEPLLYKNWGLITRLVLYAKEQCLNNNLDFNFTTVTNGMLNKLQLEWIKDNASRVQVSFDGPEDIQNKQRPLRNGRGSFENVYDTLCYLGDNEIEYGVRVTVTKYSVERLPEIVDFFSGFKGLREIHLEPLFECGRCITSRWNSPESSVFTRNYIDAVRIGKQLGMRVRFSGDRLQSLTSIFCGACGDNLCVTYDGFLSSCPEVTESSDSRSQIFFYGRYNPEIENFDIFPSRINNLKSRSVNNLEYCRYCFAKYHCAGDCPAKAALNGDFLGPASLERCKIIQNVILHKLEELL